MGNICAGKKEESKKASAFEEDRSDLPDTSVLPKSSSIEPLGVVDPDDGLLNTANQPHGNSSIPLSPSEQKEANERIKKAAQDQARYDLIVQATGRAMVAVRSTRTSAVTGYYCDQGFAAALLKHLESETTFPDSLPIKLPPVPKSMTSTSATNNNGNGGSSPSNSSSAHLLACLSQPDWERVVLGEKDGLAGCAGENPATYMDHIAEKYLDAVVPKKEQLFSNTSPMIENLL